MNISWLSGALWAASFAENAALLLVLLLRRRWTRFRFFSALVAFNVIRTIVLYTTYRLYAALYGPIYWTATAIDLVLQVTVVLELLRIVLRPAGIWAADAERRFRVMAIGGFVAAVALSFAIHHRVPHGLGEWTEQGELFSVSLAVVLLVAMAASTTALGLIWRRHVAALAVGWAIWNFTNFFVEGAYSYFGPDWHGFDLDNVRIVIYELVTIYWIIMFWLPEPAWGTLSAEQQECLSGLQKTAAGQVQILSSNRKK